MHVPERNVALYVHFRAVVFRQINHGQRFDDVENFTARSPGRGENFDERGRHSETHTASHHTEENLRKNTM